MMSCRGAGSCGAGRWHYALHLLLKAETRDDIKSLGSEEFQIEVPPVQKVVGDWPPHGGTWWVLYTSGHGLSSWVPTLVIEISFLPCQNVKSHAKVMALDLLEMFGLIRSTCDGHWWRHQISIKKGQTVRESHRENKHAFGTVAGWMINSHFTRIPRDDTF